jgi:hypothetical protein
MMVSNQMKRLAIPLALLLAMGLGLAIACQGLAADASAKVYVILWFDTEDYILPASDDAAVRVADWLTRENIRATFKVVGEKARMLERRGRTDVIAALKKHEIGFHANWHSVQPSPAMYLSNLGWDEGVGEFLRREGPGFEDVKRIFGQAPTCYGQPGSSWGPQTYGGMRRWGMGVYLDAGRHVLLDDKPYYYCGILNLYKLAHTVRTNLGGEGDLKKGEDRFLEAREKLLKEGGGIVSIFYHPCEFVHEKFWDGVNFSNGANPPREEWQLPPMKTPEASAVAYRTFEDYIRFIKRFPEVQFITATQAAKLYRDRAREHRFLPSELKTIAGSISEEINYYKTPEYALSPAEIFALLNQWVADQSAQRKRDAAFLAMSPIGPVGPTGPTEDSLTTTASQFQRTALDVADYLRTHQRIPTTVWLGSVPVTPEAYLRTLAEIATGLIDGKPIPESITIRSAKLATAKNVADDAPNLWGWVIFPRGFRAPAMMELAKRQAWTLKPAILGDSP